MGCVGDLIDRDGVEAWSRSVWDGLNLSVHIYGYERDISSEHKHNLKHDILPVRSGFLSCHAMVSVVCFWL